MENIVENEIGISVCMATYNGEKYLKRQLESILVNLTDKDELIISDDGSSDETLSILKEYARKNKQIVILKGPRQGVIKNFENALKNAKGNIIFLADQDDEWEKNKVEIMIKQFDNPKTLAVVHDAIIVDAKGNKLFDSLFEIRNSKAGLLKNLLKNSYVGCCMAIRSELLQMALPFPNGIEMHDWWLGLISDYKKGSIFINDKLIKYRRHDHNVSGMKHYPLIRMVENRIYFINKLTQIIIKKM